MKTTTLPWYVKLALAITGGLLSIAAIGVDLTNSYLYGLMTTNTMAALAIICALAVVILPVWLELGAPRLLWLLWAGCVVFTMNCAYQYYFVSATQNNTVSATIHEVYATAAEEKTLALATLKRITKHGDVEELAKLAANADANLKEAGANVAKYCKGKHVTEACTEAQTVKTLANTSATLAHTELSDSKAWHEAKATLAKAGETQKQGDATKKNVDVITMVAALILVQFLAGLSGVATSLAHQALVERAALRAAQARKPRQTQPAPTNGGTHEPVVVDNVVSIMAAQWLKQRTTHGAGLPGGEAKKSYERFAGHKISAAQFRSALTALLGADAIQAKNNGYVVKGYALAPLAARNDEKRSAVC